MSAGDMPKMYEQNGLPDPSTMAEGSISKEDIFSQTLPDLSPSPQHMVAAGNHTNSNESFEEDLIRLSVDDLSYHHHNPPHIQDVFTFENGVSSASMDITHPQNLGLNMGNSYKNTTKKDTNLVQERVIDVLPYEQSTWDSTIHELQDMGYANHLEHQQAQDQEFQLTEAQNCSQSYNSSSTLDPPYPSPDLMHLLHIPRCSASAFPTNPIQNTTLNFQGSMGFLGDLPIGSNNTSASSVLYDPLLHLNMSPQPAVLGELFQSLPHGYTMPTGSRSGFLFRGGDEMEGNGAVYQEGDGSQLDIGVLEFNRVTASIVGKGRKGKDTKQLPTEKQRREQLNGRYQILRNLIPNPTKVYITIKHW